MSIPAHYRTFVISPYWLSSLYIILWLGTFGRCKDMIFTHFSSKNRFEEVFFKTLMLPVENLWTNHFSVKLDQILCHQSNWWFYLIVILLIPNLRDALMHFKFVYLCLWCSSLARQCDQCRVCLSFEHMLCSASAKLNLEANVPPLR